jgi:hypothetical protein
MFAVVPRIGEIQAGGRTARSQCNVLPVFDVDGDSHGSQIRPQGIGGIDEGLGAVVMGPEQAGVPAARRNPGALV